MKNKFLKGLVASFALAVSGVANAGLINVDFLSAGDNLLVLDESTNYEWALISHTGNSIDYFNNSSIYSGQGFTIATANDLLSLWTNGGATNLSIGVGNADASNMAPANFIASIFGHSSPYTHSGSNPWIHGLFDNGAGGYDTGRIGGGDSGYNFFEYFRIGNNNATNVSSSFSFSAYNVWAYREAEPKDVPEPSTLAIFALSIIGLASRKFKKQA